MSLLMMREDTVLIMLTLLIVSPVGCGVTYAWDFDCPAGLIRLHLLASVPSLCTL